MRKRIFSSMLLLTIVSLLAVSTTLCAVFYMQFTAAVRGELRERAALLRDTITPDTWDESLSASDMRLTIVATDGTVLFDDDENPATLENHADREEIESALAEGVGESHRFSSTLGQETFYFAIRLADGSVLRLAKTTSSIWGMFGDILPAVFLIVLVMMGISYFLAGRLTRRIVNPINKVDIESNLSAPYDELAPFVQTISRQREHIAAQVADLQSRSETISAIMDSMSEGIILINRDGVILSVNQSAANIFSVRESAAGQNILILLRNPELIDNMREALRGTRSEMNLPHDNKTYRVFFSPVTDSGALILFLDITEKNMSEKLRREFSANVSHELKTPLTTIYGNAEMLESGMVRDSDKATFYAKIKKEASRLIALIEDILMLSRLDEEPDNLPLEAVDLYIVAAEAAESLARKAEEQEVTVTIDGEATICANRSQMTEMFYNLIENAIKYNRPGGSVTIDIRASEGLTDIRIADTGIGIPGESQTRVFERFYRVDKSRSKKTGGTGLGLAIVKHIVMAYDGSIDLQSEVGTGTVIRVVMRGKAI